ncbi:hypothetical protein C8_94 [Cannes 8 virus]|nr:hypothetical protein C8_94 [Cannes 8 virus]AVR52806.1 hypothetical protein MarSH_101 [Marseillevirus Shanghai 1]
MQNRLIEELKGGCPGLTEKDISVALDSGLVICDIAKYDVSCILNEQDDDAVFADAVGEVKKNILSRMAEMDREKIPELEDRLFRAMGMLEEFGEKMMAMEERLTALEYAPGGKYFQDAKERFENLRQ